MTISIEMTVRGILLAGHWRTEAELNNMTTDNKRNTLIVVLTTITNQSVGYFQSFDDNTLVAKAAVPTFLLLAGLVDESWLKTHSDDDSRNALIVQLNMKTDKAIHDLQGKNNGELVTMGLEWLNGARMVTGIIEFSWKADDAKILATVPDWIAEQTYLNDSNIELNHKFVIAKEITNTSTFSHEHDLTVQIGVSTMFKAGIPYIAENKTTVAIDVSTTNTWKFGEENSTTQKYSDEAEAKVPPHTKIKITATVTKASLNVPYRAKVRLGDGTNKDIEGTWNGVSTYNLVVKQQTIDTVTAKERQTTLQTIAVNPKPLPVE